MSPWHLTNCNAIKAANEFKGWAAELASGRRRDRKSNRQMGSSFIGVPVLADGDSFSSYNSFFMYELLVIAVPTMPV